MSLVQSNVTLTYTNIQHKPSIKPNKIARACCTSGSYCHSNSKQCRTGRMDGCKLNVSDPKSKPGKPPPPSSTFIDSNNPTEASVFLADQEALHRVAFVAGEEEAGLSREVARTAAHVEELEAHLLYSLGAHCWALACSIQNTEGCLMLWLQGFGLRT